MIKMQSPSKYQEQGINFGLWCLCIKEGCLFVCLIVVLKSPNLLSPTHHARLIEKLNNFFKENLTKSRKCFKEIWV
jgi:hypothetical protein